MKIVDGCVLSILKRERSELNIEDKLLLKELRTRFCLREDENADEKDVFIFLLKKARKEDETFNEHKCRDLQQQIAVFKNEKSIASLITMSKEEREQMEVLKSETFRLNRELVEAEKNFNRMRTELMEHNTQKVEQLYKLFEKNKVGLTGLALDEYNNCVNELFAAPLKYLRNPINRN